ncbi:MAG: bifunctional lysylphosphatidylglycerol flippase/synthetase MprF [Lactobacillaceae bacterium]|jgi:phosphatidylglycerol lysyltransferase|nr:bifunctional lysylphosphatidylglycerol flippase/synthetase MprF [Lactobacillaceae bacterium]
MKPVKSRGALVRKIVGIATAFAVFFELGVLIKRLNFKPLLQIFKEIPTSLFIIFFITGILLGSVALGYDYFLQRALAPEKKLHWREWLTIWAANAVRRMVDTGGFVSTKLHQVAFGKNSVSQANLRQFYWWSMTGLSILSLHSLALEILKRDSQIQHHFLWLLIGIFFPFIGLLVTKKRYHLEHLFPRAISVRLTIVSLGEWLANVGAFLLIGFLFGMPVAYWHVYPLFIAAQVIGVVTLIPGAWGSFDLVMILGLRTLGMDIGSSFLWVLIYRLSYTVTPFVISLFIFIWRALTDINNDFRGVPKSVATSVMHKIVSFLLYFEGITLILTGTFPGSLQKIDLIERFTPWESHLILQLPNIFIGFMLLVAGRGIMNKVKRAFVPTLIIQVVGIAYVFFFHQHWQSLLLFVFLLLMTIFIKPTLTRDQFIYAWESQIVDGLIYGVIFFAYIALGIANLPTFKTHFKPGEHHILFLLPSMHWWITGLIAILIVVLAALALVRYFAGRTQLLGESFDEERVQNILALGDNHYSNLVFLGDKRVFYYEDSVAIQFRLVNNKAVMMSDPFGAQDDFKQALDAFIIEADRLGYQPVFYEVSESIAMMAHEFGYNFLKLGEEAWVDTTTFKTAGKKFANIRSEINQATAAGFTFSILQPPYSQETMQELHAISDEWLNGRDEKGFSLGYFDEEYLQRYETGILQHTNGRIVAFATLVTSHTENQMTVDLMRFSKESPNGTMDVLFVKAFEYAQEVGFNTFNLGMSPLANVGINTQGFVRERMANLVYQFGSKIYSFEGLHHYKNKFASSWNPYYIAYSSKSNLVMVMLALLAIDNPGVDEKR